MKIGTGIKVCKKSADPSILLHPNVPKPLHTLNPRTILGRVWWDRQRKKAYRENNYCCSACGVNKMYAKTRPGILEAHEFYKIDYAKGSAELEKIFALCNTCHSFIHSGRLFHLYDSGKIDKQEAIKILEHGFEILSGAGLQCSFNTQVVYHMIKHRFPVTLAEVMAKKEGAQATFNIEIAPWEAWHLVLNGKKYYSPFKNYEEWEEWHLEQNMRL